MALKLKQISFKFNLNDVMKLAEHTELGKNSRMLYVFVERP